MRRLYWCNVLTVIVVFLAGYDTATMQAQQPAPPAQTQGYMVLSSTEVFIHDPAGTVSSVQALDLAAQILTSATVKQVAAGSPWWDAVFPSDVFQVATPAKSYYIFYRVGDMPKDKPAAPLQITLAPTLSITIGPFGTFIRDYWLGANIALKYNNEFIYDLDRARPCPSRYTRQWHAVTLRDKTKLKTIHGGVELETASLDLARTNPDGIGAIHLCLDNALVWRQNTFPIDPASGNSLLQGVTVDKSLLSSGAPAVQFADGAAFVPQSGPASKDAAVFYANLQIAAGSGAAGAWGLDGKVALFAVPFLRGSWTLASATANTGNNTSNITGTTYTDTIDWNLPGSWAYSIWTTRVPTTLTLIASPDFETDREFDKQNVLFSGDSIWTAKKLYQPQSYRSLKKATNGVLPKYGDPSYANVGYELEGHAGVESGGALVVTTVKNTQKTASIKIPTYQIERVVPQIHGLYQQSIGEFGLLSFDSVFKSRYLFDSENTVRQSKSGALSIKEVSGWKAINTLTSTWNPPKNNNVGLTVTYKNGFDAPKFSRVNSVLAGVVIQF